MKQKLILTAARSMAWTFAAMLVAIGCSRGPRPGLEIEDEGFYLSGEGDWTNEISTVENTVYKGVSGNRRIVVSRHPMPDESDTDDKLEFVGKLVRHYHEAEMEVSEGKAEVDTQEPAVVNDVVMGGFRVVNPSQGRVVYARILAGDRAAFTVYYEIFKISSEPDFARLSEEFIRLVDSVRVW